MCTHACMHIYIYIYRYYSVQLGVIPSGQKVKMYLEFKKIKKLKD